MPIRIADNLPARRTLEAEGVIVMSETEAARQDIRPLRIALLGAGSVGSQVARLLIENKSELAARVGAELELVGIAVRDINSPRNAGSSRNISRALFSNSSNLNALDLVKTPRVLITLEGLTKVLERTKN